MTRGRRSGLTGFGGVRNEGVGGLRMGIRGKSRGGEEKKIKIMEQWAEKTKITVLVNVNKYQGSDKAYIQIPHTDDTNNIDLIISGTGDGLTDTDLLKKISVQWRYIDATDDPANEDNFVYYHPSVELYLTNVLDNTESDKFKTSDTQIPIRVSLTEISRQTYKLTYHKYYEHNTCADCGKYLSRHYTNWLHGHTESDQLFCSNCSLGHCNSCGVQLDKGILHTPFCKVCGAEQIPHPESRDPPIPESRDPPIPESRRKKKKPQSPGEKKKSRLTFDLSNDQ